MLDRVLDDAGWLAALLFIVSSLALQWLGRGGRAAEAQMAPLYVYEPMPGAPTATTWLPRRDALLIVAGGAIILVAWLLHGAGRGDPWVTPFVAGFLLLRQVPLGFDHLRFRAFADAVARGGVTGGRMVIRAWVGPRVAMIEPAGFALVFGVLAATTGQAVMVGGALGCLVHALRLEQASRRG